MSSKFSEYYAKIRAKTLELANRFPEGDCIVIAGRTAAEVPVPLAAKLLTEGTHSLASNDQVRAFREAQTATHARSAPATTLDEVKKLFAATMRERGIHGAQ
jgi:hypothetical protein